MSASAKPFVQKSRLWLKDTLISLTASMGVSKSKRGGAEFCDFRNLTRDWDQLATIYRTNWIGRKIVEIIPDDMCREWRTFDGDNISPEKVRELEALEEHLSLRSKFNEADRMSRLYGGALIIIGAEGTGDPEEPLELDAIKPGSLEFLNVVDRTRVHRSGIIDRNPLSQMYGQPMFYRLNDTTQDIHYTRVLRFDGNFVPYQEYRRQNYWHDSVLENVYDAMVNAGICLDSSADMMFEANVDVAKVKGLMNHLATDEGTQLLQKRFGVMKIFKSNNNITLIDSEEELNHISANFSGIPDIIKQHLQVLASVSDIPAMRFLGTSPTGLNATGDSELEVYYDKLGADQEKRYGPALQWFDQIMARSLGFGENNDLSYKWNSLFQLSDAEKATLQESNARRDDVYLNQGVIKNSIVARQLQQDGVYTAIDDAYIKEVEEAEKLAEESDNDDFGLNEGSTTDPQAEDQPQE